MTTGIPIMRWGNWTVLTRKLRDLLKEHVHDDGRLDQNEMVDAAMDFVQAMESTPFWFGWIAPAIKEIIARLNIDFSVPVTDGNLDAYADMIVALIRRFAD